MTGFSFICFFVSISRYGAFSSRNQFFILRFQIKIQFQYFHSLKSQAKPLNEIYTHIYIHTQNSFVQINIYAAQIAEDVLKITGERCKRKWKSILALSLQFHNCVFRIAKCHGLYFSGNVRAKRLQWKMESNGIKSEQTSFCAHIKCRLLIEFVYLNLFIVSWCFVDFFCSSAAKNEPF